MRTKKSFINIIYNLAFNFINLFLGFFSRAIFLQVFNTDYLGLITIVTNIIGVVSLMELGVSAAIAYTLYSHLQDKNYKKINELMKFIKITYSIIGFLILGVGILVIPFFDIIFKSNLSSIEVYVTYLLFLITTAFSYFMTYKQVLAISDQNAYVITRATGIIRVVKTIIQIAVILYAKNFLVWVILECLGNMVTYILINREIDRKYSWLNLKTVKKYKELARDNKNVLTNIKNIMVHKISGTVTTQTDSIIISIVSTTRDIALYSNYLLIVNGLTTIISQIFNGFTASIGNLISEGNNKKSYKVFLQLYYLEFFIGISASYTFYKLANDFIGVWIGKEYIFTQALVFVITCNFFIQVTRRTVDFFKDGYGIFWDVYAPLLQVVINLFVSIYLGEIYGVIGVYLGTLASSLPIIVFWRPYILFKAGFKSNVKSYFMHFTLLTSISLGTIIVVENIMSWFTIKVNGIGTLLINGFMTFSSITIILFICLFPISYFRTVIFKILSFLVKR
ncbi:lipopolysaccharide biosynthesis protein [Bacillus wiedmannii]|uniref:lipopolysaccharide biosynthesis protein n=1 Tax=Bacillus wiedmannii TaxID=1890302 RepID=UPI0039FCB82B